ncbi:MAG: selenium-dependent molybdenum cofactor biosynthesis protein YqeB [Chloroflexota bacterium]
MAKPILIRGGGDLASGVALRLHRAGFPVVITELPQPLSVRRAVSFSEAIYEGEWIVEGVRARRADSAPEALSLAGSGLVPVLADPELATVKPADFQALVDARLLKTPVLYSPVSNLLIVGLGPGFTAGENCHAVVETMRGHTLGRVYWSGTTHPDSGQPEGDPRRVLRAPADGVIEIKVEIGQHVEAGETVAVISDQYSVSREQYPVVSAVSGVVRGLIHSGLEVGKGLKIGDIDPRDNREYCFLVSDKALAVGGAVLEALLKWQVESAKWKG